MHRRALIAVALCACLHSQAGAQTSTKQPAGASRGTAPVALEHSLGSYVLSGAIGGLFAGMVVAGGVCVVDTFPWWLLPAGDANEDGEDDGHDCGDADGIVLPLLIGPPAGALLGLVVGALGIDLPDGAFILDGGEKTKL